MLLLRVTEPISSQMVMDKLLKLFMPPFFPLYTDDNDDDNNTDLIRLL